MDILQQIKVRLEQLLNAHQPQPNTDRITALQLQTDALPPSWLAWLKAQQDYPQFYWHHRDDSRIFAAVGKVRSFSDLISASAFVQQDGITLVGGATFNGEVRFYLPRLLLEQTQQNLRIRLFIDNNKSFAEEKQVICTLLKNFPETAALKPIQQTAQLKRQAATQNEWQHWVKKALNAINAGTISKAVLANESEFAVSDLNSKDFLAESEKQNSGCYHFLFTEHSQPAFVGSTPERLYARQGRILQTEALAGTAPMTQTPAENERLAQWLLNDEKNLYENNLVVQDISHNLQPYSEHIEVKNVELKQLRQVQHLCRKITVTLNAHCDDAQCLAAIHPTAAVSGLPQQAAIEFLKNTENFDRTWYAGTLGFMQQDSAEFCVTIRSAFIEADKFRVFAGAGIVAGSDPLLEWQEIERKAAGLVSLLQPKE